MVWCGSAVRYVWCDVCGVVWTLINITYMLVDIFDLILQRRPCTCSFTCVISDQGVYVLCVRAACLHVCHKL